LSTNVTFQGNQRIISVHPDVTEINVRVDLYSEWKRWVIQGDNTRYLPAFRYAGGDIIIDNTLSTETYVLLNGWKISIGQDCVVDGIIKTEDGTAPFIHNSGTLVVVTNRVNTTGGNGGSGEYNGPSSLQIARAVRTELSLELGRIDASITSIQSGTGGAALTPTQATMLLEMYILMGLDPTQPLIVTQNSRAAGNINQSIASSSTDTIVTRM
jgi:hypothetical protein